ncbi:hypothetical protein OBBRIDRAFT_224169 [Obba rivulosa]|uniref:Uncharacterized protein n=1 Tax=Obba rivulosa TaxID=1052685 RepID=A0A8E2DH07_9APHY|nr:hypothetical protein OBBRIDRAFT_224169 [Obba rivulosa]
MQIPLPSTAIPPSDHVPRPIQLLPPSISPHFSDTIPQFLGANVTESTDDIGLQPIPLEEPPPPTYTCVRPGCIPAPHEFYPIPTAPSRICSCEWPSDISLDQPQERQTSQNMGSSLCRSASATSSVGVLPKPVTTPRNVRRQVWAARCHAGHTRITIFLRNTSHLHVWPLRATLLSTLLAVLWSIYCLFASLLCFGVFGTSDYEEAPFTSLLSAAALGGTIIGSGVGLAFYCITWPKSQIHTRRCTGDLGGALKLAYHASPFLVLATGIFALPLGVVIMRVQIHGEQNIRSAFNFSVVGAAFGFTPVTLWAWCFYDVQDYFLALLHC